VVANLKVLSPERAAHWGMDMDAIQRHADHAGALPELTPVWRAVYKREAWEARDVDENLYGGFVSNNDRKVLTKLRRMSADQLNGEMAFFEDPQLAELLFRYRARNFPHSLPSEELGRWRENCRAKLSGDTGRGFPQFRQELAEARAGELDAKAQHILEQLEAYAAQL
jgi:exodeoxyribonuclease-1